MAIYSIVALKNRITELFNANRARIISGVHVQEILHDVVDSIIGLEGEVETGLDLSTSATDYGLTGETDRVNQFFATSKQYSPGSIQVYLNGVRQFLGQDYLEKTNGRIYFIIPPFTGDKIIADYKF